MNYLYSANVTPYNIVATRIATAIATPNFMIYHQDKNPTALDQRAMEEMISPTTTCVLLSSTATTLAAITGTEMTLLISTPTTAPLQIPTPTETMDQVTLRS